MNKIEEGAQYVAAHVKLGVVSLIHAFEQGDLQETAKRAKDRTMAAASRLVDRIGTHIMAIDPPEEVIHADQPEE